MTDEKREPGRPRKWSSDAERIRAARAAKREQRRAAEEWSVARQECNERRARETFSTAPVAEEGRDVSAQSAPNDFAPELSVCSAEIDKLRAEVRRLEDEYDDVVVRPLDLRDAVQDGGASTPTP